MATNPACPALIDPPYWGGIEDRTAYRDHLQALAPLPGLGVFVAEADRNIARLSLRRPAGARHDPSNSSRT